MAPDDARRAILAATEPLQPIELPLAEAYGCVAAAEVATELDIPPFSAAGLDGFAARSADIVAATEAAPVRLRISGWALAGRPPEATVGWGEAVRIAGGAPLPAGADCVVPSASTEVDGEAVLVREPVAAASHVSPAGTDVRAGEVLVPAGRRLAAVDLGILATAGYGAVLAYPKLRVAVIALGDLVEPGRSAGFGQPRDASSYLLLGALREAGAVPYRVGIVRDVEKELHDAVTSNALRADAFAVSGGEPGSAIDVATALAVLGDVTTYSVAIHPGGELGHGVGEGKPFFHLAGAPDATFVSYEVFVRPAILRMMGRDERGRPELEAVLDEPVTGPAGAALYVPVDLRHTAGAWHCSPIGSGEGGLGAYVRATGLLVVPPGDTEVAAGSRVQVQVLRAPGR